MIRYAILRVGEFLLTIFKSPLLNKLDIFTANEMIGIMECSYNFADQH